MDFDRKTILAFVLIGLILLLANTGLYQKLVDPKGYELRQQQKQRAVEQKNNPAPIQEKQADQVLTELEEKPVVVEKVVEKPVLEKPQDLPESLNQATEKTIVVETDLYKATFSSRGAAILQWELKKYPGPDGDYVRLFRPDDYGTLGLGFTTKTGDSLGTGNIVFETTSQSSVVLSGSDSHTIEFVLPVGENRSITKTYTLVNGKYAVKMNVNLKNMDDIIADKRLVIGAPNGLASTESRLKDDMMYAKVATFAGGDLEKGYKSNGKVYKETGSFDWVAVRTKYFAFYIVPQNDKLNYAEIVGDEISLNPNEKDKWKKYSIEVAMPYLGERNANKEFMLYLGPLEYDVLKKYDYSMHDFMDFGWGFIKWFSLPILKSLKWMHNYIPNYGIVLLIFALLIKIIVYPLTHKSYESMQKMQAIQPKLKELQEKYKSDPQKLNQATMAMYKEEGVNPMGGCLPMLIQMPLLFGLFIVFRTTIELRGEGFMLWITDLSAPDTIYTFPGGFTLPLYGNTVNILPLVMGVTMFIQQKMTVTDPKQKMMVYFMPIFLTLLFNSFPSGLNLYYALFNALSIIQQKYLTPKKVQPATETPVVKKRKR
jgi:YidC/Oxa1 family membrane protein insertase